MGPDQLGVLWLILASLGLFLMIFGNRYLRNKENMAMIEKGMDPKLNQNRPAPYQNLKWGLLLVGSGIGLFVAHILVSYIITNHPTEPAGFYFSLIAIGGGIGLISSYRIEKRELLNKGESL